MNLHYTIVIQWSNEDRCYLVHLPEFTSQTYRTHGENYEEAFKCAYLEDLIPNPVTTDCIHAIACNPVGALHATPLRKGWEYLLSSADLV